MLYTSKLPHLLPFANVCSFLQALRGPSAFSLLLTWGQILARQILLRTKEVTLFRFASLRLQSGLRAGSGTEQSLTSARGEGCFRTVGKQTSSVLYLLEQGFSLVLLVLLQHLLPPGCLTCIMLLSHLRSLSRAHAVSSEVLVVHSGSPGGREPPSPQSPSP